MNPDFLINGVLQSVLGGGGRKKSKRALRYLTRGHGSFWTNPTTLMTAAGLAWGVFDTLNNKSGDNSQWGGGTAPANPGAQANRWGGGAQSLGGQPGVNPNPGVTPPLPPLPNIGGAAAAPVSDEALRIVRLAVSAASADGVMNDQERAAVVQQAQAAGVGDIVEREIANRRPLAEIVTGVSDPGERATLYVLAFTVLRADEQLTGAERI